MSSGILREGEVVLEIVDHVEHYRAILESRLKEISKLPLAERAEAVWKDSRPYAVTCTVAVDHCLVLDGSEDEESWKDLVEAWEA